MWCSRLKLNRPERIPIRSCIQADHRRSIHATVSLQPVPQNAPYGIRRSNAYSLDQLSSSDRCLTRTWIFSEGHALVRGNSYKRSSDLLTRRYLSVTSGSEGYVVHSHFLSDINDSSYTTRLTRIIQVWFWIVAAHLCYVLKHFVLPLLSNGPSFSWRLLVSLIRVLGVYCVLLLYKLPCAGAVAVATIAASLTSSRALHSEEKSYPSSSSTPTRLGESNTFLTRVTIKSSADRGKHNLNKRAVDQNLLAVVTTRSVGNNNNTIAKHSSDLSQLPLAFILLVLAVSLAVFIILLTFWYLYQRHTRSSAATGNSTVQRGAENREDSTNEDLVSPGKFGVLENRDADNQRKPTNFTESSGKSRAIARNSDSNTEHPLSCYNCLECCRPKIRARAATDLAILDSAGTQDCPGLDDCGLSASSNTGALLYNTSSPLVASFGKVKLASLSVTDLTCAELSISPSLASRRRAAPPPPLLHTAMPSILTPSPSIKIRAIPIQPDKTPPFTPYLPVEMNTGLTSGAAVTSPILKISATGIVGSNPILCTCPVHSCLCSATSPIDSLPESQTMMPIPRAQLVTSGFGIVPSSVNDTISGHEKCSTLSQEGLIKSSLSATKVRSTTPMRARTKGLLESRRGSHTSLTLSLSPSSDSPVVSCSGVLPSKFLPDRTTTSLDEATASCDVASSVQHKVVSTVACPSDFKTHLDETKVDHSNSNLPPEASSTKSSRSSPPKPDESSVPSSDPLTQRHSESHFLCHGHHHHHHHYHHHYHHRFHHQLHTAHCGTDPSVPCPLGSQSCQRSRELEQLANATQPMTYEELIVKLRDNAASLFQEFWNIPMNHASKKDLPIAGVGQKNRYQSILPNFSTRVVLPMLNNDPVTTYINANYIRGYAGQPNAFIATQGPMSHTISDFWRMVWHSHAPAIVMITKLVEKCDIKCELYLPNNPVDEGLYSTHVTEASTASQTESSFSSGSPISSTARSLSTTESIHRFRITSHPSDSGTTSMEERPEPIGLEPVLEDAQMTESTTPDPSRSLALPGASQVYGEIQVSVEAIEWCAGYSVRQLRLRRHDEERHVTHFWYTAWPDHSSPETNPSSARQLLQLVHAAQTCRHRSPLFQSPSGQIQQQAQFNKPNPELQLGPFPPSPGFGISELPRANTSGSTDSKPIVVHCSAGLGRTGCFIALCIGCDQLRHEGMVDVLKIVSRLRLDRGGMVQTNEQYEFIHHALAAFPEYVSTTTYSEPTKVVLSWQQSTVVEPLTSGHLEVNPDVFPSSDT